MNITETLRRFVAAITGKPLKQTTGAGSDFALKYGAEISFRFDTQSTGWLVRLGAEREDTGCCVYVYGRDRLRVEFAAMNALDALSTELASDPDCHRSAFGFPDMMSTEHIELHLSSMLRGLFRNCLEVIRGGLVDKWLREEMLAHHGLHPLTTPTAPVLPHLEQDDGPPDQ
jgi:hypothetical protein